MKIIGVIPARYNSSRFPGKPLADICGRPMIWWTYNSAVKSKLLDDIIVATDDERIADVCNKFSINCTMTSLNHDTPTSRLYEVSQKISSDLYVFIGGDEPLIDANAIDKVISVAKNEGFEVTHAMTTIKTAPEVIDFTNIKVVVSTSNILLYTTRSPIPYPKGGLDYKYKKFVGIGAFTKNALKFYNDSPKSKLEKIEECDLIRFINKQIPIRMVDVKCRNISVDTQKDLEYVITITKGKKNEKNS